MVLVPENRLDAAVVQAATTLAHALQATSAWQEWRSAEAAFEGDAELAGLMDQYRTLALRWRKAQAERKPLAGKEALELAEVQERTRGHRLFARRQRAAEELAALLLETNQAITAVLGIDFAANAAPAGEGCYG